MLVASGLNSNKSKIRDVYTLAKWNYMSQGLYILLLLYILDRASSW